MSNQQKIALRKWPLLIAWCLTLGLAALGYWLIQQPFEKQQFNTIGYALAGFFGFITLVLSIGLLDFRPGLVLDQEGLLDPRLGIGKILWTDIQDFEIRDIKGQGLLLIGLKDKQLYLLKATNFMQRKKMDLAQMLHGTPIAIKTTQFKIRPDELKRLLQQYLRS